MQEKGFIKYIVIIAVILAVAFLSQQAYYRGFGKTLVSNATSQAKDYVAKSSDWVMSNIYPKISGEVQKRGGIINNEVNKEKQKVSESVAQKISNYFSGVTESVLHPGTPQNCPATQTGQPTQGPPK